MLLTKGSVEVSRNEFSHARDLMSVFVNYLLFLSQDAAKEVEQAHPEGVDFLIANAGVGMVNHDLDTPNIEQCGTPSLPAGTLSFPNAYGLTGPMPSDSPV